jgi:hypothetical protein
MGVGQPATIKLDLFGSVLYDAFGHMSYHVGSSLTEKTGWRDVDIRLMLPDDEYDRLIGDSQHPRQVRGRLHAFALAFSTLGQQMTGLPIDFQIQRCTEANKEFKGRRSCIGIFGHGPAVRDEPSVDRPASALADVRPEQ